jgi:4-amino-4-deoxy-L-arabinose transferase-like glycosyltransferase
MGICSAPNNGDVLIYHLPRQLLWISQGSVFPSAMPYSHMHQMPPLTEWIGVQLYLLTGSDRFHFLIQWSAFGACLILAGGIARSFGADRKQALLAAAYFATLPAAFFQASNSKNDVFLAALLLGIFQLALEGVRSRRFAFWETACCAYLAALAVLAKGTAFAYLPFAAVAVGAAILKNWKSRQLLAVAAGLLIFTLTVSPHYLVHFAEIFTSESGDSSHHANARIGVATGASVFLRNFALQLALPFDSWNKAVEITAAKLAEATGVSVRDSGSTFHGAPFEVTYQPFIEDSASGFFHFILPLAMLLLCWVVVRDAPLRHAIVLFAMAFLGSVILFSMLFRYQIWHSRLMIPAVAVAAPGVGIFLGSLRCRGVAFSILCVLALWLAPSLSSWARPLVGKLTVFQMDEDAAVSRAGSGASFLPSYGKAMSNARITNVGLDLQNGVVHAAIRFLPLSTNYDFPATASYADYGAEGLLSNLPIQQLSENTKIKASKMERVASMEGWNLWLWPENTLRAESKVIDLPNLWGVEEVEGLGEWQGPYPQFKVQVFAKKEGVVVRFKSTRTLKSAKLLFDGAPEGAPIPIIITHEGSNIYSANISKKTGLIKIPLEQVDEGDIFEIHVPESSWFRIYSFRILNEI